MFTHVFGVHAIIFMLTGFWGPPVPHKNLTFSLYFDNRIYSKYRAKVRSLWGTGGLPNPVSINIMAWMPKTCVNITFKQNLSIYAIILGLFGSHQNFQISNPPLAGVLELGVTLYNKHLRKFLLKGLFTIPDTNSQ